MAAMAKLCNPVSRERIHFFKWKLEWSECELRGWCELQSPRKSNAPSVSRGSIVCEFEITVRWMSCNSISWMGFNRPEKSRKILTFENFKNKLSTAQQIAELIRETD